MRARWLAARTRNAVRHGLLIGAISCLVTLVALLTFVLAPRQVDRALASALQMLPAPRDTQALLAARRVAVAQRESLQTLSDSLRAAALVPSAASVVDASGFATSADVPSDTMTVRVPGAAVPAIITPERRALEGRALEGRALEHALARARQAPLVESYQALVTETVLRNDAVARTILDSIEQVHREREAYAALGGPDARYAALTARLTNLGDRLLVLGAQHLRASEAEPQHSLRSNPVAADGRDLHVDSVLALALRDATQAAQYADSLLGAARLFNGDVVAARAVVRDRFVMTIPPVAALLASLVLGIGAGFGVALWRELRWPTVGDAQELAALTGTRVIVHRARRQTGGDAWPLLHLSLTHVGDMPRVVQILCDQPMIAAAVGVHLATVAARESRETALVDLTERGGPLRALLPFSAFERADRPAEASRMRHWDTRRAIPLGPDTAVDLVRARSVAPPLGVHVDHTAEPHALVELQTILASYDFAVLVADRQRGQVRPSEAAPMSDVVLCARLGVTPLAWVRRALRQAQASGWRVRAVVMWTGTLPGVYAEALPRASLDTGPLVGSRSVG